MLGSAGSVIPIFKEQIAAGGYSAAQWLAPFARQSSTFFEADPKGLELLQRLLQGVLSAGTCYHA